MVSPIQSIDMGLVKQFTVPLRQPLPPVIAICRAKVKSAIAEFANNQQQASICYEISWKELVLTARFADSEADFGNTY